MEYYWHFAQVGLDGIPRLGYGDDREVKVGETLTVKGRPVLCEHGLHASGRAWDALGYVQAATVALCRVTLGGTVVHGDDKSAATERTVVTMLDTQATEKLLRDWGRWCALQVIHLWDAPDVVRQYLETGDESLRGAARAAAYAADADAAADAAARAARAAAYAADAADAADAAAYAADAADAADAAAYAADAAAYAAAYAADAAAYAAARAAAYAAAYAAARAAARANQQTELERRALVAMGLMEEANP